MEAGGFACQASGPITKKIETQITNCGFSHYIFPAAQVGTLLKQQAELTASVNRSRNSPSSLDFAL